MEEGTEQSETTEAKVSGEMEREKIQIEVKPESINKDTVNHIENILTTEAIKENRIHAHGINVLGEGVGFYDRTSENTLQEALKEPHKTLNENAEKLGLSVEKIDNLNNEDAKLLIQEEVRKRDEERIVKRKKETELLEDLEADGSIKIHMCRGPFDLRVAIPQSPDTQKEAFNYVQEQLRQGRRVVIALGPGMISFQDQNGELHKNIGTYVNPESKAIEKGETSFHIPTQAGEIDKWQEYCGFIARECKGADFDVWVEANHNLDDNGHGNFRQNEDLTRHGEFSSEGRSPKDYAVALISASKAVKEVSPESKVGINIAFADADFVNKTIDEVKQKGEDPLKVIDYVSFNPYRFGKKPEEAGPVWNENLEGYRGEYAPKGKFDWGDRGKYEEQVIGFLDTMGKLGIKDIRIGESGWPKESLTEEQRAQYNLRGWLLDRYLCLPESPWTLTSEGEEFSFVDNKGEKTPTYSAYRNFNKIFSSSVKPVGEIKTDNENIVCKVFKDEKTNDDILAVWLATDYYDKSNPVLEPIDLNISFSGESDVEIIQKLTENEPSIDTRKTKDVNIRLSGEPSIIRRQQS